MLTFIQLWFYGILRTEHVEILKRHSYSAGLVDFYIQVNQTSTMTLTLQKTKKNPTLIHGENFAYGTNIEIILHNFFQLIALSNNQQHAFTQDIIGKQ